MCAILDRTKINSSFLQRVNNTIGYCNFITHEISAQDIKFIHPYLDITEKDYSDKISKVHEKNDICKYRDLKLNGRAMITKSLMMSKLPKPEDCQTVGTFSGRGDDEINVEMIIQNKDDGGLNKLHPSNFITSLKLKNASKNCRRKFYFTHPWKLVARKQKLFRVMQLFR